MSAQAERIQTGQLREDPVSKLLLQFSFPEKMFPHAAILKRIALLGTPQFFLQLAGAVTNIIPDPVFIFGFGWGMNGAASIGLKRENYQSQFFLREHLSLIRKQIENRVLYSF